MLSYSADVNGPADIHTGKKHKTKQKPPPKPDQSISPLACGPWVSSLPGTIPSLPPSAAAMGTQHLCDTLFSNI